MGQKHSGKHLELKAVLRRNGEFTNNLYSILAEKPGNVFFSPIGIHAILSLACQGATGCTRDAFIETLNVPSTYVTLLGYKEVMSCLNSISDVTLLMANKLYLRESCKLRKAFNTVAVRNFLCGVKLLDFSQRQAAAARINAWVKKKTQNKITDIINPMDLTDDTDLVLVNAIYFKGKWAYPFNVRATRTEKFYVDDVDAVDVQMMHIIKKFVYKEDADLDAKVLELPYVNKSISLVVVLPNERNGIAELEQKLAGVDILKLTENMHSLEVAVFLPKFKIEQTIDLKEPLTDLGLGIIFGGGAEFSGITKSLRGLHVSKMVQKAFIEVNEEGTEAAAAIRMQGHCLTAMSLAPPPPKFIADHPFFIILRSSQHCTTNILFAGRISKPKY